MGNKKAFEMQFNWIFVLIAGAAILIFFSSIIIKQKNITQSSTNIEMLKQMENIISGASVSADTIVPLEIPTFEIKISCNKFSIGTSLSQYNNLILFAPSLIKGNKLVAQTMEFREPYRSTNLLFLTSMQARYILIGGDSLLKEINKTLPTELDKQSFALYEPSKIRNTNNYKVKLIFSNVNFPSSVPDSLAKMPDSDVTAVKINGDLEKGTIDFYKKEGKLFTLAENSAYTGKSSLIAAIYAENPEMYNCNMNNVFLKNSLVTEVYKGKTGKLLANHPRPECRQIYSHALPFLNKIEDASSRIAKAQKIEAQDIDEILGASESLSMQNNEARKFSCPTIY